MPIDKNAYACYNVLMATNSTTRTTAGPRPTPRPAEQPRLHSVDSRAFANRRSAQRFEHVMRTLTIGVLGLIAAAGAVKLGANGLGAAQEWARNQQNGAAEAEPRDGDVCVVVGQGVPRVMGDEFADGTNGILEISNGVTAVINENPDDRVGICRPPESDELGDNHVVPGRSVDPGQEVDFREFDALGGVSHDVTLGDS